jgi:xylan 1,4-beta-xylosidase
MPKALSSRPGPYENSSTYRLDGGCFYPPKDYDKWAKLIRRLVRHCAARHKNVEKTWLWELWNEPNIGYWHGTFDQYCRLFDHTEQALHGVLPNATLGGPHTAGAPRFLRDFLNHCANGANHVTGQKGTRLDYIGFHAKGGVSLVDDHVRMNLGNQLRIHRTGFQIVADFPGYRNTPIIIGEADPDGCAGCPSSKFPERNYRNFPAYGAYEVATMKHSLDLARRENVNLQGVLTWAFMFDGMPWFDGFRTLATNGIHKPVLNAFKMLGCMTGNEVPLTSEGALGLDSILDGAARTQPDINGMAVTNDKSVKILIWNYHDHLVPAEPAPVKLRVKLPRGFGQTARITHYRIDDTHSNAYTKWLQLGSPQNPTEAMLKSLRSAMQLQTLEPAEQIGTDEGRITLDFDLPRFALSLITLEPPPK